MSSEKKPTEKPSETSPVVSGSGSRKNNVNGKSLIVRISVIVALIIIVIISFGFYRAQSSKTALTPLDKKYNDQVKQLELQAKSASSNKDKAAIYQQLYTLSELYNKSAQADGYAKKSQELDPSASNAAIMGDQAAAKSDWKSAVIWYQRAVDASPKESNPNVRSAYNDYVNQLNEAKSHL